MTTETRLIKDASAVSYTPAELEKKSRCTKVPTAKPMLWPWVKHVTEGSRLVNDEKLC